MLRNGRIPIVLAAFGLALGGCARTAPSPDAVLSDDQIINMIDHADQWHGRVVTVKIYPFDNGFTKSFVACFEQCDAEYASRAITLVYTKEGRFTGFRGEKAVVIKATFRKICPDAMPVCLDDRFLALDEIY